MAANESPTCLFCGILKGTVPCHKIYETEHSFAFLDIMPTTEGHTQVIPKYHAETLADLPDEYLRDIGPVVRKIALATGVEAYNIVQNNGKLAFQHIPHVHFHVIPKPNETEGLVLTVGQNWPQKKVDNDVLAVTCEKIKGRL
ncbi:hit domain protein [Moniliophthora roreri MCA 2997]|uniref:Hit domain protein n=2 Tax=Moniliophthora roreri TaxID=221103 RepID=V2XCR8_MONRO|nr:hit domain protein [Moniliophthora roreri MCA 2997]KAI3602803.1 hit domain protein [Moniliophthora roreri]